MLNLGAFLTRSPSLQTEAAGTAPPDAFGPFRVLHQIGAGTLGPVFRAYDAQRERLVAVKLFRLDLGPERVQQLVAELERLIAAELRHPAMAVPFATGVAGAHAYLAQDYVAADSLDLAIRDYGVAPPASALHVAELLAGALDLAPVSIGHGALHPRDVLLANDETRLTGVGIARALERIGVTPPVRRPYTAPERVAGAVWDRRADVFSLAAIIYELLWGRRIAGTGMRAIEGATELPGAHLAALQSTFARALADDPEDRFETALEFAAALKEAFPGINSADVAATPLSTTVIRDEESRLGPLDEDLKEEQPSLDLPALDLRADGLHAGGLPEPEAPSVIERSRSAVWPLLAALAIGLAIGFAGGYGVASRERWAAIVPSLEAPAGRESTEVAVSEPPKSVPTTPAVEARRSVPSVEHTAPPSMEHTAPPRTDTTSDRRLASLFVRSIPAGARVIVDGQDSGQTPVAVRSLLPGVHRVRVQRDGYVAGDRRVTLSRDHPAQSITVSLGRLPSTPANTAAPSGTAGRFVGRLVVESRPSGATVYLDGRAVGTTPMSMDSVQAGEHAIRLEQAGYRRWSSAIRVVAGAGHRVTASLEK